MTHSLRIAMAQINSVLGDLPGNIKKHIEAAYTAEKQHADLIVFPELSLTGYPPEDLLLRQDFLSATHNALHELIKQIRGVYCLVGHPSYRDNQCYNTATLFYNGETIVKYHKRRLPNYGVFDENRYFTQGAQSIVINIKNIPVGILICEDVWHPETIADTVAKGAKLLVVPNASPFESNKHEKRVQLLTQIAQNHGVDIVYTNLIGGQDELVFDGGSMAIRHDGKIQQLMPFFQEQVELVDFSTKQPSYTPVAPIERIYQALCIGVKDYVEKNNIPGVLIGLSGGIDSALTLAIAVDALGKERVHAVMMPSQYTADISKEDAATLAKTLGIQYDIISIDEHYEHLARSLKQHIADSAPAITFENIQARIRGVILMALSNASGKIVLNTGNRSELATGYCTLYGDMVGGFAVLKDVPKTTVYELAHYRNTVSNIIPERVLTRAPTAELAPNQKDEDSLPPYAILDQILELYLNQSKSKLEIIAQGFNSDTVEKVIKLIHRNEYKRKQAPIGTHINNKSFGKDWRYPLTNRWKE